ncbi:MAG TPA: sigma-70 family RNA polymerase sigma factor [Isosphaeraceae bacterium]|nr:sigma-70 family RNA polymerase sigma factor [Isosphaeraceae bacterium]
MLEALRLLDASSAGLPTLAAALGALPDLSAASSALEARTNHDAWDLALHQTASTEVAGSENFASVSTEPSTPAQGEIESGLAQLNRYLSRCWSRAGVAPQQQDDCTQAVYASLLQNLGRDGFDHLAAEVGQQGIPQVLNRDSALGPDFFRVVDMVKKRATRQKTFVALDDQTEPYAVAGTDGAAENWRGVLNEAIDRSLNPREADLIRATLEGFSPSEIASRWGVAPKTVSNEKTRALQKLRDALTSELGE